MLRHDVYVPPVCELRLRTVKELIFVLSAPRLQRRRRLHLCRGEVACLTL